MNLTAAQILLQHPYNVWQGVNEKWYTYLPHIEKDGTAGRRLVKRSRLEEVNHEIVAFYREKAENPFSEYIFLNAKGGRMTTNCFRNRLYRVCDKLRIPRRSPHKIRKTYASILLDNHMDKKFVETQMGHTNILRSEQYYHMNRRSLEDKRDIINSLPEFSEHMF